ncbi:hypothetical protein DYB31_010047, partial [Aphanomyces astaci]
RVQFTAEKKAWEIWKRKQQTALDQAEAKRMEALEAELFGKKKRRRDTLDRVYLGDYLNVKKHTPLLALLKASKESHVLFAGETHKINEKFVAQTRLLLIGEMNVHNIKADKMDKPKERRVVPIAQLSKISMSSLHDNYLFLHVNNDVGLMYEVDQKTEVELCKRDLPVTISDTIEFEAKKGMRLAFRFVKNQSTTVTTMEKLDKKNGQVNVGTKY